MSFRKVGKSKATIQHEVEEVGGFIGHPYVRYILIGLAFFVVCSVLAWFK